MRTGCWHAGLDAAAALRRRMGTTSSLIRGEIRGLAEHANLERRLVAALTNGCERMVVGYALKEEYFNEAYPAGVENVAYDFAERPQLADLHSHREAQGISRGTASCTSACATAPRPPGTRSAASPTPWGG